MHSAETGMPNLSCASPSPRSAMKALGPPKGPGGVYWSVLFVVCVGGYHF